MTNVANNTLVYKAVAKGLAMLGDQIDKDNRKLIQMLASLDKLQIKLSKGRQDSNNWRRRKRR